MATLRLSQVGLAACLISIAACTSDAEQRAHRLAENSQRATATIKHTDCESGGAIYYAFSVEGQNLAGRVNYGRAACRRKQVGDQIAVFYDTTDPRFHTTIAPGIVAETAWIHTFRVYFFVLLGIALISVPFVPAVLDARRRRRLKDTASLRKDSGTLATQSSQRRRDSDDA